MSTSDILAIALLACAIFDTVGAQFILPGLLAKNNDLTAAQRQKMIQLVNVGALVFFLIAVFVYLVKPLD